MSGTTALNSIQGNSVIDLNELWDSVNYSVEQERKTIFMEPRKIMEVIRRAIAAESERDELKSKLSQFEREIPKTPEGFPELDKEHLIKICINQQAKLAEIEAQEPAIEYIMDGGFPNARFNGYQPKVGDKLYLQPIANNSEPQRITEQDAREIAEAYSDYPYNFKSWLKSEGREILAKLNEHSEPVADLVFEGEKVIDQQHAEENPYYIGIKPDGEPYFSVGSQTFTLMFDTSLQDRKEAESYCRQLEKAFQKMLNVSCGTNECNPVVAQAKNAYGWSEVPMSAAKHFEEIKFTEVRYLYDRPQVTPNKAEAPNHIEADTIGFVDANGDVNLSRQVKGGYLYWGDAPPIPPLKGE